ncbi:MAG: pseudaminic acid cytidylyltransferase [Opitutales bacterium]
MRRRRIDQLINSAVAFIPARGNSKRIPQKNIREFCGKPMIAHSILAAQNSGVFDQIIVSTDSPDIAEIAEDYGAICPFLRPNELSDDHTPTAPVIEHGLKELAKLGTSPDYLCCIYATAPLIQVEDLRAGFDLIRKHKAKSVFSVTTFAFPIFRALKMGTDGTLSLFWPEHELTRSQDLPEAYHDAGQFYWIECERFRTLPQVYSPDSLPVILPRFRVQDIDTLEDWARAEMIFRVLENSEKEDS